MYRYLAAAALAATLSAGMAAADTITFSDNFLNWPSELSHGDFVSDFDFGNGLTGSITVSGGTDKAQIYDTTTTGGRDPDLESPTLFGGGPVYDGDNVLIIAENDSTATPDDNARGGTITFMFDSVVEFTGVTLIDAEPNGQEIQIIAGATDLGSFSNADDTYSVIGGFSYFTDTITFVLGGSGAIDNLKVSAVPLPAPILMLLTALCGLGVMRRWTA